MPVAEHVEKKVRTSISLPEPLYQEARSCVDKGVSPADSINSFFVAAILVGGTFMGITALGLIQARALATGDPRRALALMTGAFGLGQIVGPAFAGIVSDRLGSFTVPSITAAVALLFAAALTRN